MNHLTLMNLTRSERFAVNADGDARFLAFNEERRLINDAKFSEKHGKVHRSAFSSVPMYTVL